MANIIRFGGGGGASDLATRISTVTGNHNQSGGAYSSVVDSGEDKLPCFFMIGSHNYSTSGSGFRGVTRLEGSDNGSSWTTLRTCESSGGNGHNVTYGTVNSHRYYRVYGGSNGGDVSDIFAFVGCVTPAQ